MDTQKTILDTIKEKYLTFKGRLNRKPFLIRNLLLFALSMIMRVLSVLVIKSDIDAITLIFAIILLIYVVFTWWSSLSLTIRRLHDIGHSAKTLLLPLIFANVIAIAWVTYGTIIYETDASILDGGSVFLAIVTVFNFIFTLYLFFKKGTNGKNKYGDDPLTIKFLEKFREIEINDIPNETEEKSMNINENKKEINKNEEKYE